MTDYISRQAAIDEACKGCNDEFSDEPCEPSDCCIMQRLADIQPADVVPKSIYEQTKWERDFAEKRADDMSKLIRNKDVIHVVRCKDCKYWQNYHDVMVCGLTNAMMSISDYCSFGERADK